MAGQKAQTDKVRRIIRQLDGAELENLFKSSRGNVQDLVAIVMAETIWSGALILRHVTADRSQQRDSFVAALNRVVTRFGNKEQADAVTKHLRQAALIERGFSEILASVERSEVTRLSPDLQLWS